MTIPIPKPNKFFQTALLDPSKKSSSPHHRPYLSATPSRTPPPPVGTIKVTISRDRVWHLPKALLARHSTYFSDLCQDQETTLDVDARDFANFVDYIRSSVYSLNERIDGFRAIRRNTNAFLLGQRLGSNQYSNAALRQLHTLFSPLAHLRTSNARKSSIRASDVEFVCSHTALGSGLRRLFFDAVASHWSQLEVVRLGAGFDVDGGVLGDTMIWADVYRGYEDFRDKLAESLGVGDLLRGRLLRDVEEYLEERSSAVGDGGKVLQLRSRAPSLRWTDASERRRMERAQSGGVVDDEGVRRWKEGMSSRQGEEEAVEGGERECMIMVKDD